MLETCKIVMNSKQSKFLFWEMFYAHQYVRAPQGGAIAQNMSDHRLNALWRRIFSRQMNMKSRRKTSLKDTLPKLQENKTSRLMIQKEEQHRFQSEAYKE